MPVPHDEGRRPRGPFLAPIVVAVALFSASTVLSQPVGSWGPVAERVRELEARVARLELRLIAAERALESRPSSQPVAAFPDDTRLGYGDCQPPYVVDAMGTRLLKAGCESAAAATPCDPMFVVDRVGIKTRRPGCEKMTPQVSCDPPFVEDPSGSRVVRRECLDVGY